jgi:hypothetical protein
LAAVLVGANIEARQGFNQAKAVGATASVGF